MKEHTEIYQQYAYSYPHKLAYRELENPYTIKQVWQQQPHNNLFAYLHIPYCEMRCGFCNLFTIANPKEGINDYLTALRKEAQTYKNELPNIQFEEYAIGGGTPTFLNADQLAEMLNTFKNVLGVHTQDKYGSIESSPKSISQEKIKLIEEFGINRISIGIQSWIEEETKQLGRPQPPQLAAKAVDSLAESSIPEINIDLIYGINGQTENSWQFSLNRTVEYNPTEIYLYPLYTRPLTGLEKRNNPSPSDHRLKLYRIGRDFLLENGYQQVSMRCFRKTDASEIVSSHNSRTDGMIGIGAGARSYTANLHYSSHYAVGRKAIKSIIHDYAAKQMSDFNVINYGIQLTREEQIRRFFIKSLIDGGQLNVSNFKAQFGQSIFDFEIINELFENKWVEQHDNLVHLTVKGMEMEDYIGPALFSKQIKEQMKTFELE